jgi:hypothetical protein
MMQIDTIEEEEKVGQCFAVRSQVHVVNNVPIERVFFLINFFALSE